MFRNLADFRMDFGSRFNLLFGDNGQGKTNILEAIYYLGTVKSFRHAKSKDVISWGQSAAVLRCNLTDNNLRHSLSITIQDRSRELVIDGKNLHKIAEYCDVFSVVAYSPVDMNMIGGTPEDRRRYLDRAIFSSNSEYLAIYYTYFRALKQRNHLLKNSDMSGLEAWTKQLAAAGAQLVTYRHDFIQALEALFIKYYTKISGSDENARLCYYANSLSNPKDIEEIQFQLLEAWSENRRLERERGMTMKGPHRDDLQFILNDKLIREHGSQGQQKSFVLALKMAEIELLEKCRNRRPILLLDDMTAELDANRIEHLLDFLFDKSLQVFITSTSIDSVPLKREHDFSCFKIERGRVFRKDVS